MASKQEQEQKLPLTLLVDKEKNLVVVAEANGDFIDILFSFLTLPLGTIIRILSKNQQKHHGTNDQPQKKTIGCIENLYKSVENLSDDVFWNSICKTMLLYPRNTSESFCKKLKLNEDDSEPTKYFTCSTCEGKGLLSTFAGVNCSCGKLMDKEKKLHGDFSEETHNNDGVFVKKETLYLIFDDLKVLQSSPSNTVEKLLQLGYRNINKLTQISLNVGLKEILDLLKKALTSKSPLSEVFLATRKVPMYTFISKYLLDTDATIMNLKVTVSKSNMKILYAEAGGDFVDFLFSFLTTPIGSIQEELNGNYAFGCIGNLHKSVKELNPSCFIRPLDLGNPLPNPKVAHQFGCMKQPLKNLCEEVTPTYWYGDGYVKIYDRCFSAMPICSLPVSGLISKEKSLLLNPIAMKIFDPRYLYGKRESVVGFVKKPSLFVVWDDLQVASMANTSSIAILQTLNIPMDDLEELVVNITSREALYLLGASLDSSEAALTEGLLYYLLNSKEKPNV